MPKGTKVHRCVDLLVSKGVEKGRAIATCQKSTNQSFKTGKPLRKKKGKK
jgi:hypothetical protein